MKKITLIGLCAISMLGATAQKQLVKDIERQLKSENTNYEELILNLQPAFTNPETANTAEPNYLAGKASLGIWNNAMRQMENGAQMSNKDKIKAGRSLIDAYDYYTKALPLDQLPDEKGKIKPKRTKEIKTAMALNYAQLRNAGIFLFEAQDYDKAYDAWELYVTLPQNPNIDQSKFIADPDTIVGQIMFYQSVAMLSDNQDQKALDKLQQVLPTGFQTIDVYRYGMEAARRLNNSEMQVKFAKEGYDKYGNQDVSFVGVLINDRLAAKDFNSCRTLLDAALSNTNDPKMESQLYSIYGIIMEEENDTDQATQYFQRAITLDSENAKAYYDLGRMYNNRGAKLDEETQGQLTPEAKENFLKAAEYFEKAYNLDETNMRQIPNILYRLYYRLDKGYEDQTSYWESMR